MHGRRKKLVRANVRAFDEFWLGTQGVSPNMFTKSVEARRKVAVSTPSPVIGTSAKDWRCASEYGRRQHRRQEQADNARQASYRCRRDATGYV